MAKTWPCCCHSDGSRTLKICQNDHFDQNLFFFDGHIFFGRCSFFFDLPRRLFFSASWSLLGSSSVPGYIESLENPMWMFFYVEKKGYPHLFFSRKISFSVFCPYLGSIIFFQNWKIIWPSHIFHEFVYFLPIGFEHISKKPT